ncbi:SDR family oxidoreductase [Mongoliibacter ruber]|uniref:dTDP-4-dehydrorhamnose reductase n=1 Tax=Mongoliibacter ruber TaxID=1750599 RepID=A0A2T0WQC9_9BACT|nr:SDR family oxidoreductase [Mongoliibacter ruber]PRY88902.1 dTDP-4-dehydrorhamnose reductase [Mongoliibacter ruber]
MKKILITGANGLLGQKLVQKLMGKEDLHLIATGVGASRLPASWSSGYTWESMDITDPDIVNSIVGEYQPDCIIHTAAMTQVDDCENQKEACWKANVDAVANMISVCEQHDIHLVHLSTDFIFDGENGPYDEKAIPRPVNYYGEAKLEAERLINKSKCRWAIARTVLVYGLAADMSRSNIILWVKKSLESGKQINVVTDQWRTPTLAEDLADGCILIFEHGAEGIFNISGEDFLTPYDMAMQTATYFGLDHSLINKADSSNFSQPAQRPLKTGFIIEKAKSQLGYNPKSFMDGIGILSKQLKLADS